MKKIGREVLFLAAKDGNSQNGEGTFMRLKNDAPLLMKRVGDYTVAVFNPIPFYTTRAEDNTWGRIPLVCAVSDDDGKNFTRVYALKDDPNNGYCYPAIIEGSDYFLVSYYHSNNGDSLLNSCKIIKVMYDEIR